MLGYDIVDGVGILRKQEFKNPYWRGVKTIPDVVTIASEAMTQVSENCQNNANNELVPNTLLGYYQSFLDKLTSITTGISSSLSSSPLSSSYFFSYTNPDVKLVSGARNIIPTFVSSLGNIEDSSSDFGKFFKIIIIFMEI